MVGDLYKYPMLPLTSPCWPVHRWPYRQAFATGIFAEFERDNKWEKVHESLAAHFDRPRDNHVTFEVKLSDRDQSLFITFHDNKVFIGTGVRPMDEQLGTPQKPIQQNQNE